MKFSFLKKYIAILMALCLAFSCAGGFRVVRADKEETETEGDEDDEEDSSDNKNEGEAGGKSGEKKTGSNKGDGSSEDDEDGDKSEDEGEGDKKENSATAKKPAVTATSKSLQETINQAKKNAAAAQSALEGVNKQLDSLSAEEEALTAEEEEAEDNLTQILEELASLELQLGELYIEIETTRRELVEAEEKERDQYEMMKLRIAYMYENNDRSTLATLLSKGSISEMLNALEYMNSVYDYDRDLLDEYEATVEEIEALKCDLENERIEMEAVQDAYEAEEKELELAIIELEKKLGDVDAAIASATKKANDYEATIAAENAKIKKAMEEQARLEEEARKAAAVAARKSGKGTTPSGGGKDPGKSTSISGSSVVDYACQFVGNPYVFGGNSLTGGTDCSGFVNLVMGHFGVGVPRSSYSMQHAGNEVSYENARAGDIVCYPGHVAIYMGGGQIVHAKGSMYGITTDNIIYSNKSVITIRRVL